jgi:hypothetical protein
MDLTNVNDINNEINNEPRTPDRPTVMANPNAPVRPFENLQDIQPMMQIVPLVLPPMIIEQNINNYFEFTPQRPTDPTHSNGTVRSLCFE